MALTVPMMIHEAVDSLTRADASRLEALAQQAVLVSPPRDDIEREQAAAEQHVLARLLALTRHNLRLLGRDPEPSGSYGMRRG